MKKQLPTKEIVKEYLKTKFDIQTNQIESITWSDESDDYVDICYIDEKGLLKALEIFIDEFPKCDLTWQAVVIDESEYWTTDVIKLAGKILAVYVFDPSKQTFLCEVTPSFDLELMQFVSTKTPDNDADIDELDEFLTDVIPSEHAQYMHCKDVERIQVDTGLKLSEFTSDEVSEDFRANGLPESIQNLIK